MSRRFWTAYASLLLLRLYFALSKSYVHPDEMFQGPEVVVADIFQRRAVETWEFKGPAFIRSAIPLYIFQYPALYLLNLVHSEASPTLIFQTIRFQQFCWTLVLDRLVYLISKKNKMNLLLLSTSYTTMVYHTHTFSNSWETVLVLATLYASQGQELVLSIGLLACLGLFTRISFIFFMLPMTFIRLRRSFDRDPKSQAWLPNESEIQLNGFVLTTFWLLGLGFIYIDTIYYTGTFLSPFTWSEAVVTVWNNIVYNGNSENLAKHGIHPRYTHVLNALVLLGPACFLVRKLRKNLYTATLVSGVLILSLVPHQEARFILPCTTLFLASVSVKKTSWRFWVPWILFNTLMALFMGTLHQCGVIPVALYISEHHPEASVTWTKSYPAPQFLLGGRVQVDHVYGDMMQNPTSDLLVAPLSGREYEGFELLYTDGWHMSLDDMDVSGLKALTNRGLGVYKRQELA